MTRITFDTVSGDGYVNSIEALFPVTITGTSDAIGKTVHINSPTGSTTTALVRADGKWTAQFADVSDEIVEQFVRKGGKESFLRELQSRLKPGAPEFTLEELKAFLKDRVGKHEMVQAMAIRAELPKTLVGKLSKKELYEEEAKARH